MKSSVRQRFDFVLNCTHEGVIQEVLFVSAELAPFLVPAASLFGLVLPQTRAQLHEFFTMLHSGAPVSSNLTLSVPGLEGLQVSVNGLKQGNRFVLNGFFGKSTSGLYPLTEYAPLKTKNILKNQNALWPAKQSPDVLHLQKEVRHLRQLLQAREEMLNSSSDIICSFAPDGTIHEINRAVKECLGFEPSELVGRNLLSIICKKDHAKIKASVQEALHSNFPAKTKCAAQTVNRQKKEMLWTITWSAEARMLIATAHDISEYVAVTNTLKKNKKELKEAQMLARIGGLEVDLEAGKVVVSSVLGQILGLNNRLILSLDEFSSFIHPKDLLVLQSTIRNSSPDNNKFRIGYRFAGPGNRWLYLTSHTVLQRNHEGKVIKIIGQEQDVTEQHKIQQALRLEQQRSRMVVDTALEAFIAMNGNGVIIDWNHAAETIFGWSKEEVIGREASQVLLTSALVPAFDDEAFSLMENCRRQLVTNARFDREILNKNGGAIKAEISITCFGFNNNIFLNAFIRDVTERQLADELLRQSERRFRALVQSGADIIGLLNEEGVYQYVSHNVSKYLGYKPEDLLGTPATDYFHPDDHELVFAALLEIQTKDFITIPAFRFRNASGEYLWMETTVANLINDPSVGALVANSRDITDKKQAQEEKERLAAIIEATSDAVGIADSTGKILYVNTAYQQQLGALPEKGSRYLPSFYSDEAYKLIKDKAIPEAIRTGSWQGETVVLTSTGEEKVFSQVVLAHKNKKGEVEFFSTVARNISERKELELELRESKERYKSLFDHNPDGVFALDWEGNSMSINQSLAKMLEVNEDEFTNQHFTRFVAPQDIPHATKYFEISKKAITATFDLQLVSKKGRQLTVQITTTPIMIEGKLVGVFGIAKDITERHLLDEALRHSNNELRALTAHVHMVREEERKFIAREIHDELGQQLTALKIDMTLLANKIEQIEDQNLGRELRKQLESMMDISDETINCIRRIVKDLRPIAIEDLGLVSEIKTRLNKFGETMGIETELEVYADKLPFSTEQATDIFRIFQESLTNITRHANATKVVVKVTQTDKYFKLEITDNGSGIPENKLDSTTSFGLLGMRERAYNLKGDLKILSLPKGGTSVLLIIPAGNLP